MVGWLSQPRAHRHAFERQRSGRKQTDVACLSAEHPVDAPQPVARASQDLGGHPDDELAEVAPLQHAEKGCGRLFQAIHDIFTIADAAIGDPGTDLTQECRIVCFSKFRVCPTFYTRDSSIIWGPFSIKSAMSRERYFIAWEI